MTNTPTPELTAPAIEALETLVATSGHPYKDGLAAVIKSALSSGYCIIEPAPPMLETLQGREAAALIKKYADCGVANPTLSALMEAVGKNRVYEARRQAMILTGRFASILELAEKLKSALEVTQDEGLTEIARLEADVEKLKAERDAWERRAVSAISLANKKDEDITRLTSQLEQAERVIAPFGKFGTSYADGKYLHQHGEVFHIWPATGPAIITVEDLKSASQWIKDRQAKGEG